ncbi:hypothetical protein D3C85_1636630 [compost metagenome]
MPWTTCAALRHWPTLFCSSTGTLRSEVRVAALIQRTRTQGEGTPPGAKAQPMIGCWSVISSMGAPSTSASLWLVISWAMPPCGHITVLVVVRIGIMWAVPRNSWRH